MGISTNSINNYKDCIETAVKNGQIALYKLVQSRIPSGDFIRHMSGKGYMVEPADIVDRGRIVAGFYIHKKEYPSIESGNARCNVPIRNLYSNQLKIHICLHARHCQSGDNGTCWIANQTLKRYWRENNAIWK